MKHTFDVRRAALAGRKGERDCSDRLARKLVAAHRAGQRSLAFPYSDAVYSTEPRRRRAAPGAAVYGALCTGVPPSGTTKRRIMVNLVNDRWRRFRHIAPHQELSGTITVVGSPA
ncbi:hypothetical protein ACFYY2_10550 [Streptomyces sp. NPDC001822]|uniref:hypothetical protein n=1 Tax=Streptomyces sp. NPDC001822 TaxID=3364614 RepID=UPI003686EE38